MAVARRGLAGGRLSHAFSDEQFLRALDAAHALHTVPTVYAELDGAGRVVAAGAGGAGGAGAGAALLAARARLAPHRAACNAEIVLHTRPVSSHAEMQNGVVWLALRVREALAPHDELRLWPAAPLAAGAHAVLPGSQHYECDACNAQFDDHISLKEHTAMSCGAPEPHVFWRRLLLRLRASAYPSPPAPSVAPPASMEALEALATAWGRARGAHVCVYCGKLYSRRYGLKIHIRTHTGYKPLRCRHCARAFGDPSNLNKHVRLHTASAGAEAPMAGAHACPRCGAVLARRRDLQRHLRARHPSVSASSSSLTSSSTETDLLSAKSLLT